MQSYNEMKSMTSTQLTTTIDLVLKQSQHKGDLIYSGEVEAKQEKTISFCFTLFSLIFVLVAFALTRIHLTLVIIVIIIKIIKHKIFLIFHQKLSRAFNIHK